MATAFSTIYSATHIHTFSSHVPQIPTQNSQSVSLSSRCCTASRAQPSLHIVIIARYSKEPEWKPWKLKRVWSFSASWRPPLVIIRPLVNWSFRWRWVDIVTVHHVPGHCRYARATHPCPTVANRPKVRPFSSHHGTGRDGRTHFTRQISIVVIFPVRSSPLSRWITALYTTHNVRPWFQTMHEISTISFFGSCHRRIEPSDQMCGCYIDRPGLDVISFLVYMCILDFVNA